MPEGVEVKLTSEEVNGYIGGYTLLSMIIVGGRYKRHGPPKNWEDFKSQLPVKLNKVSSKGKGIFFEFDNDWTMYNTLGMSGQWSNTQDKYSVIKFIYSKKYENQEGKKSTNLKTIYFRDIRNFGTIKFVYGKEESRKLYDRLGPDMMDESTTLELFRGRLAKYKHKNIVWILMSQHIISGIGNYIKAEVLYRAKISPHRNLEEISDEKITALYYAIKEVMKKSYELQGNSFHTYRNFQSGGGKFYSLLRVYRQEKDPDGRIVIREKTLDGRTTHWVKEIQT
jgi:DNA-formamidopyrimidine glycosylase